MCGERGEWVDVAIDRLPHFVRKAGKRMLPLEAAERNQGKTDFDIGISPMPGLPITTVLVFSVLIEAYGNSSIGFSQASNTARMLAAGLFLPHSHSETQRTTHEK